VTSRGEVYTWGLGSSGQLGVSLKRGMITNMIDDNGVTYSKAVQKVKAFNDEQIE
jgi:hypothetical protein